MAKVYSLHMIALKAGANGEDFERYFREEFLAGPPLPGMKWRLLPRRPGRSRRQVSVDDRSREHLAAQLPLPCTRSLCAGGSRRTHAMGGRDGLCPCSLGSVHDPFDMIFTDYVDVSG